MLLRTLEACERVVMFYSITIYLQCIIMKKSQFKKQSYTLVNLKYLLPTASVNKKAITIFASCCLVLQNADWVLFLIKIKPEYYLSITGQQLSWAKWRNNNIFPGINATFSGMSLLLNFWAFHSTGGTIRFSKINRSILKISSKLKISKSIR